VGLRRAGGAGIRGLLCFLGVEHACAQNNGAPTGRPGLEHEFLAERPQQSTERVDCRGDAVALDARDRRLRGVRALREFLLGDVVALADTADEIAGRGVSVVRHDTRFRRMGVVSFRLLRHFAQ
jgi:hypothetical protein